MLLEACLGLQVHAREKQVRFISPLLPPSIAHVEIRNLRVGEASVDVALDRSGESVAVTVNRREGELKVVTVS